MSILDLNRTIWGIVVAGMLLSSSAFADTNAASWHFEQYAPGTVIVDTGGVGIAGFTGTPFDSTSNAAVIVSETPPEPPNGYPLPGETHTNVMIINGDVRAEFDNAVPITNAVFVSVVIDTLIQPGQLSFTPEFPTNIQFALFFNTNGHPVIAHSTYDNGCATMIRYWTELTNTVFASNDWVRVRVEVDYLTSSNHIAGDLSETDHFYRLWLNGQLVTHPRAHNSILFPVTECTAPPNSGPSLTNQWFSCADSGNQSLDSANNWYFSGIEFSGAGKVDDTVIDYNLVDVPGCPYPPDYCAWVAGFPGLSDTDPDTDDDGDGATNWEEFISGTSPNDANDVFTVIAIDLLTGSNCIWWIATTNSGVFTDFLLYRSTNLTPPVVWDLIGSNITRDATGTNLFYDGAPPAGVPTYYRPALPTNAP